jgi:membrane fusion protein (multidrug efflux system)
MAKNEAAHLNTAQVAASNDTAENVHRLARPQLETARIENPAAERLPNDDVRSPAEEQENAPTLAPGDAPPPGESGRRFSTRTILFALLPVVLVILGYIYVTGGATMSTDNAYVQADMVGVANDIAGIVSEVDVKENQKVAVGDVLFKLDDKAFRLALDRANAQLSITRNSLIAAQANYRNMQAQIEQAKADVDFASVSFKRQQELAANNFTPMATFDDARRNLQVAQQKLASLNHQLAGLSASLNGDPDAKVESYSQYKEQLAVRDEAARQLEHTVVRAPIAGIATKVASLQPGQYLGASTSALAVVSTDRVWVQANPKETELTNVKPGQKATIEVDTYPGMQWTGTVESISPASASSFSLLPAENSSGNWVKVVQRIPLRVRVDAQPDKPQLRVGMSVELNIETNHPRGFPESIARLFRHAGA